MRKLAEELHAPLIDLHKTTKEFFERLGREQASALFMNLEKGVSPNFPEGSADNSHLQEKGAREICTLVLDGIREAKLPLDAWRKAQ
jgi:lysophospholipase L1-like esterase